MILTMSESEIFEFQFLILDKINARLHSQYFVNSHLKKCGISPSGIKIKGFHMVNMQDCFNPLRSRISNMQYISRLDKTPCKKNSLE